MIFNPTLARPGRASFSAAVSHSRPLVPQNCPNNRPVHSPEWDRTLCAQPEWEAIVAKKRVFVSSDFDNDKTLKDFIIGQSKLEDSHSR